MKLKEIRNAASFRLLGTWTFKSRKQCNICRCWDFSLESLKMWRKHTAALCQLKVPRSYLVHLPTNFSLLEHSSCMEKKWFWLHNSNITGPTSCNRLQSIKTDTKVGKKAGLFTGKWEMMLLCYAINCICFATPFFSWKHTKSDARSTIIWYVITADPVILSTLQTQKPQD